MLKNDQATSGRMNVTGIVLFKCDVPNKNANVKVAPN